MAERRRVRSVPTNERWRAFVDGEITVEDNGTKLPGASSRTRPGRSEDGRRRPFHETSS